MLLLSSILIVIFTQLANISARCQPLILTPYIEAGQIDEARGRSIVWNLPNASPRVESYSGYLTVNKEFDTNMFFWFFPAVVRINLLFNFHFINKSLNQS